MNKNVVIIKTIFRENNNNIKNIIIFNHNNKAINMTNSKHQNKMIGKKIKQKETKTKKIVSQSQNQMQK